jgi:hypothetical protein
LILLIQVWDLLEVGHLFFAKKDYILNDEQHLPEMVSLMGPPPPEFLKRSQKCLQYWDEQGMFQNLFIYSNHRDRDSASHTSLIGNWKGSVPIPDQSFETRERRLSGDEHTLFLQFLRRILRWLPEERPAAGELAYDDFLMQAILASRGSS